MSIKIDANCSHMKLSPTRLQKLGTRLLSSVVAPILLILFVCTLSLAIGAPFDEITKALKGSLIGCMAGNAIYWSWIGLKS